MSIMESLFPKTSKSSSFGLTEKGKKRAEDSGGQNMESQILCMLEEHGESSIGEISKETRTNYSEARRAMRRMIRHGLITGKGEEYEG